MLTEIKTKLENNDMRLSDALAAALPRLRGKTTDDTLIWCSNELQGYPNALDFYNRKFTDLPPYRVVTGVLKVIKPDGTPREIKHPMASRDEYFLSAPIGWLEDFASLPGELSVVELPELTTYIGRETGGTIVCQCPKGHLLRIILSVRQSFLLLLERETGIKLAPKPVALKQVAQPASFVPVKEVHSSETMFTKVRTMSLEMMREAHRTKDWVIDSASKSEADRPFVKASIDYMIKMGFARSGNLPNVFLLTEAGAKELQNS